MYVINLVHHLQETPMKNQSRDLRVRGNQGKARTSVPLPQPALSGAQVETFHQFKQLVLDFGRAQLDGSPAVNHKQH